MGLRNSVKHLLPYSVTCAIARLINRPFLEPESRCERIVEYAWVLHRMRIGTTMDFGYAGSYFAQALCLFGEVDGVDLRKTPHITHPYFSHYREMPNRKYDNIVCVSVLEHIFCEDKSCHCARDIVEQFCAHLKPGGQILLTFPTGEGRRFKGYREIPVEELLPLTQDCVLEEVRYARVSKVANTQHKVNDLALVRITRPIAEPHMSWPPGLPPHSA